MHTPSVVVFGIEHAARGKPNCWVDFEYILSVTEEQVLIRRNMLPQELP